MFGGVWDSDRINFFDSTLLFPISFIPFATEFSFFCKREVFGLPVGGKDVTCALADVRVLSSFASDLGGFTTDLVTLLVAVKPSLGVLTGSVNGPLFCFLICELYIPKMSCFKRGFCLTVVDADGATRFLLIDIVFSVVRTRAIVDDLDKVISSFVGESVPMRSNDNGKIVVLTGFLAVGVFKLTVVFRLRNPVESCVTFTVGALGAFRSGVPSGSMVLVLIDEKCSFAVF